MINIEINRVQGNYGFEATDTNGHLVKIDNSEEGGGNNFGVRPMQLLLMGLGGCSGIDIISILNKQKQQVDNFKIFIQGEREQGKEPSIWEKIKIIFELSGNIDPDKARRACELSMEKYCSVAETLRRAGGSLTWEAKVNRL
jgi:putative redox protein